MEKRHTLKGLYKRTLKHRDLLRQRATGNKWCIGRKLSPESREKMRQAMLNSEWHKKHKLPEEERLARAKVRRAAKRFIDKGNK